MSAATGGAATDPALAMRSILQRIATGPELSKDISREEACLGMRAILEGEVDPVQAGVFLIADRPFFFALHERLSGTLLFTGVIGDPTVEDSGPAEGSGSCH